MTLDPVEGNKIFANASAANILRAKHMPQDGNGQGEKWSKAPSSALQKPSLPFARPSCQILRNGCLLVGEWCYASYLDCRNGNDS